MAAYLFKPIRQSEWREALARALGAQPQEGAIPLITRSSLHDARDPAAYLRVLPAEDNAVNQSLATRLLANRGHRVAVACNGRSAGRAGKGEKQLHQPVIALTAHARKGDRDKCPAAGMDGYFTKPIRPQELDQILEDYLARRSMSVKQRRRL